MSWLDLSEVVIKKVNKPLSAEEILKHATNDEIKKYVGKYSSASAIKTIDSALARNVKQSNSKRFKVITTPNPGVGFFQRRIDLPSPSHELL